MLFDILVNAGDNAAKTQVCFLSWTQSKTYNISYNINIYILINKYLIKKIQPLTVLILHFSRSFKILITSLGIFVFIIEYIFLLISLGIPALFLIFLQIKNIYNYI